MAESGSSIVSNRSELTPTPLAAILSEVLNHLYVLIPVLDDEKHYWSVTTKSKNSENVAKAGSQLIPSAKILLAAICATNGV